MRGTLRDPVHAAAPARGALLTGWLAVALLVCGLGGWTLGARLSAAVIAPGRIAPSQNRQVVQHPTGGVIASLAVAEGDEVTAGQVLARLDGTELGAEADAADAHWWELIAHRARLEAERDDRPTLRPDPALAAAAASDPAVAALLAGQAQLHAARRSDTERIDAQLAERAGQAGAQIAGLAAQAAALTRQRTLIGAELDTQRRLRARGLTETARVLALEREAARLDGVLAGLTASHAAAEGQRTEIRIERTRLAAKRREEALSGLRDLGEKIAALAAQRRALAARRDALTLRAPASGIVLGLVLTTPRAVLRPAEPLLSIVPQDRPLVISAEVSALDIDEVRAGQAARLRLSALPARTTPELSGHVVRVSPDAVTDSTGRPRYLAEIALDPGEAGRLGRPLKPGMPVEAYLSTGSHSPADYLLKPFADYFRRAFRES
ncbi:HlyD family type I secretion periplasmic adaptor subunit [Acidimangrovimonas sediminis]|uniref:HlyD family type I secretion periplasmic adaptor subunit n=1 Tax=Acidimangrovimonas sediminis TaxID=2056283 RepID=UPI001E31AC82|nr:HlyD family type I secretion periplasmic adaptor subunit [Acidimangrovimonas sediminis]